MFQPTQPLFRNLRRLALTTKQAANKGGYYKGTRTGSMGWHTKHGRYVVDYHKVRTYVPPRNYHGEVIDWESNEVRKNTTAAAGHC
jgi:large subunit ribosomal protein L41